jgi:signal transduction histidine kinase
MMAAAKGATPEAIREILSDIQTDGLRAAQIIDRHRAMLRGHQLQERPIDLRDVLTESLAFVAQDMLARQIALTVNLPSSPCVINGDPVLLQQVIVNLVMNATDAMAETPPARRRVIINVSATPKDVELCVRDTGPGLPADIVDQLFAPFVTTKSHGLGIGLTIARRIVDAHRGTIAADNSTEGGATFKITLPRSASDLPLRTASES